MIQYLLLLLLTLIEGFLLVFSQEELMDHPSGPTFVFLLIAILFIAGIMGFLIHDITADEKNDELE